MILATILIVTVVFFYWNLVRIYSYWTSRGVKQRKQFFLLGDNASVMFRKESFFEMCLNIYKAFPEERCVGAYQGMVPTLIIRDPEVIKEITVKEFDHFLNHRTIIPADVDPMFGRNLFALKDTEWREMRSTLSPCFTSNKMRIFFSLISECSKTYLNHFLGKKEAVTIELQDTFSRYATDVIATVAFGIESDSINNKNNDFYRVGKKSTAPNILRNIGFFLYSTVPTFCKMLHVRMFSQNESNFFLKLVKETIDLREKEGIVRPDMIQQLLEARKDKKHQPDTSLGTVDAGFATVEEISIHSDDKSIKQELTDLDIAAQAFGFFLGGFHTVSTLMSFIGYELALNPDIQERLQKEIDKTMKECDGKLTYEVLMKMKYMDMVVSETLRKWPPAVYTDRVCSKPFAILPAKPQEKLIPLNPGDVVAISISGIHRDPEYYPNPDVFDPERFNDENKTNIKPYTYMPFGLGPRNCIGSRFALLETKSVFFHLLSKFNFIATEKTQIPLIICKKSFTLTGKNGMWVDLQPRIKENAI